MSQPISYRPTDGLSYDPKDSVYWDAEGLQKEITRTFEVCHGCRMCFKYCDSFPTLFDLIDDQYDGDVTRLSGADTQAVMDGCFQCKLCEVECPYTPRDNHEFQLDFPRLVHRYRAQQVKAGGLTFRQKVLGDPDRTGTLARASLGMANVMNRVAAHRWFLEKVLGVHREKLLPDFASRTFTKWAERNGRIGEPGGEAVLFQTCYVEHNEPDIGVDTLEVMERNEVEVRCSKGLKCCGMPAWESGDLDKLRKHAKHNLDVLEPWVDAGAKVIAINPTCSMMLRREYPELCAPEDQARAEKVAEAIRDPGEHLWNLRKEERFTPPEHKPEGEIAYHAPCHLRAQGVGFRGRDVMKKMFGTRVGTVMECCGHDGTYAMTTEGFEPSKRIGKKAFDGMKALSEAKGTDKKPENKIWATDCPLAAIQFEQHAGVKPMHPMTVLANAYRGELVQIEPGRRLRPEIEEK